PARGQVGDRPRTAATGEATAKGAAIGAAAICPTLGTAAGPGRPGGGRAGRAGRAGGGGTRRDLATLVAEASVEAAQEGDHDDQGRGQVGHLLVPQSLDWMEPRRPVGGVDAEEKPDPDRDAEGE